MLRSPRLVSRFALALAFGATISSSTVGVTSNLAQEGDCNTDLGRPADAAAVQGTTFTGTFEGNHGDVQRWQVDDPIAGDVDRGKLSVAIAPCHPVDFVKDRRYLVSTSHAEKPTSFDTVAYRVLADDKVQLATFDSGVSVLDYPQVFKVETLAKAITVVAPNAALPDTSAAPTTTSVSVPVIARLLLFLARLFGAQ